METANEHITDQLLEYVRNRYFGKYRGTVTDNNDLPIQRGRVKVSVPAVLGELEVWALPCLPYTGDGVGVYTVPAVGAGVWVEFEGGDPSFPIWTGGFWADNELPQDEQSNPTRPNLKIIRSERGLMLTMNDDTQVLTLSDENGGNIMTFEMLQGKITVKGNIKVVVEAPQIELVENATHPVVFGDELMSYLNQVVQLFNSHMHPGEMALGAFPVTPAPPVPVLTPPPPSLISTKVKSG